MRRLFPLVVGLVLAVVAWFVGHRLGSVGRRPELALPDGVKATTSSVSQMRPLAEDELPAKAFDAEGFRAGMKEWREERSSARQRYRLFELTRDLELSDFPAAMSALDDPEIIPNKTGLLRWQAMQLFELWADRDLASARTWLETQPPERGAFLFPALARIWAQVDGQGLRRWFASQSPEKIASLAPALMGSNTLRSLAESDPGATFSFLMAHSEFKTKQFRWDELWEVWGRRDPTAAGACALLTSDPSSRKAAVCSVLTGWTRRDPVAASAWIAELDDAAVVEGAWMAHLYELAGNDPVAALATWAEKVPPQLRDRLARDVMFFSANRDPEAVLTFAQDQADSTVRRTCAQEAIAKIAASDPQRAAELWRQESVATGTALDGFQLIVEKLAQQNGVGGALQFLDRLPPEFAGAAQSAPIGIAASVGWPVVADAALTMPTGERRENWITQIIEAEVKNGDLAAAEGLIPRLAPGSEKDNASRLLGRVLFTSDPDLASQWLVALPGGDNDLVQATEDWLEKNRQAAARWIATVSHWSSEEKQRLLLPRSPTNAP